MISNEIRKLNGQLSFGYSICNQCWTLFCMDHHKEVEQLKICETGPDINMCYKCIFSLEFSHK